MTIEQNVAVANRLAVITGASAGTRTAHQCGTLRMGQDKTASVVDANCKAHDLDNLYVADSSVFVSSAAVNPTLTIVANAMRVGAYLRRAVLI